MNMKMALELNNSMSEILMINLFCSLRVKILKVLRIIMTTKFLIYLIRISTFFVLWFEIVSYFATELIQDQFLAWIYNIMSVLGLGWGGCWGRLDLYWWVALFCFCSWSFLLLLLPFKTCLFYPSYCFSLATLSFVHFSFLCCSSLYRLFFLPAASTQWLLSAGCSPSAFQTS